MPSFLIIQERSYSNAIFFGKTIFSEHLGETNFTNVKRRLFNLWLYGYKENIGFHAVFQQWNYILLKYCSREFATTVDKMGLDDKALMGFCESFLVPKTNINLIINNLFLYSVFVCFCNIWRLYEKNIWYDMT